MSQQVITGDQLCCCDGFPQYCVQFFLLDLKETKQTKVLLTF